MCKRCAEKQRLYSAEWRKNNPQKGAAYRRKAKEDVLNAYGNKCLCCGETAFEFLTIDHPKGDGAAHRKLVSNGGKGGGGTNMYLRLRREGYPPGLRILCWNCNCSKYYYGACPHEDRLR